MNKQAGDEGSPLAGGRQYQHQTMTLHNTVGLVFMSLLAFALLAALLRQQARYREFVERWMTN